jgi:hypothetical protein
MTIREPLTITSYTTRCDLTPRTGSRWAATTRSTARWLIPIGLVDQWSKASRDRLGELPSCQLNQTTAASASSC